LKVVTKVTHLTLNQM